MHLVYNINKNIAFNKSLHFIDTLDLLISKGDYNL